MKLKKSPQESKAAVSNSHAYYPLLPGSNLWAQGVTREDLAGGLLRHDISKGTITGLTVAAGECGSAIRNSQGYDEAMSRKLGEGIFGEQLALALIVNDARYAADILKTQHHRTKRVDGWVAFNIYPQLPADPADAVAAVTGLYREMKHPNILITLPGLPEWLSAIEAVIYSGVPVQVTALFSPEQFLDAAWAYLKGIERRFRAGLEPVAGSFAAVSMNRLVTALADDLPGQSASQAGLAIARQIYQDLQDLNASQEWQRAEKSGAKPLRLVWVIDEIGGVSGMSETYISDLLMPSTVAAIPAMRWKENVECGILETTTATADGNRAGGLPHATPTGMILSSITERIQGEEVASAERSWIELLDAVASKSALLARESGRR